MTSETLIRPHDCERQPYGTALLFADGKGLHQVVIDAVGSFRPDALICVDDIRVAAKADGYDLSNISGITISLIMKFRCRRSEIRNCDGNFLFIREW